MQHVKRDFLTIDQIADRWGLDTLDVHQLLLMRALPQTFLVSGPAFLGYEAETEGLMRHPLTATSTAMTWVLASTTRPDNQHKIPLTSVHRIYDFVIDERSEHSVLESLRTSEMVQPSGWTLHFTAGQTEVAGRNRFRQVAEALQDSTIVLTDTLVALEEQLEIAPNTVPRDAGLRDARRQRCRAVAQILWERDPRATVPDLFQNEWMRRIACESRPPSEKTFREWVKDLNPDRSPGRRSV